MKEHSYFSIAHKAVDFICKELGQQIPMKSYPGWRTEGSRNNTFSERVFTSCDTLDLKFASTFFVDDKLAFQIDTSKQYNWLIPFT